MESSAGVANQFNESAFNVGMHVLELDLPVKVSGADFFGYLCHPSHNVGIILIADDFLGMEHFRMGERGFNIMEREPMVE